MHHSTLSSYMQYHLLSDPAGDSSSMNWTLKIALSYNAKENKLRSACVSGINHEGPSD